MSALKAVHLVDDGVYLVERSWNQSIEIDGIEAPSRDFTVSDLSSVQIVTRRSGDIIAHEDADGNRLTANEYEQERQRLLAGSKFVDSGDDDGTGERVFPSLDAEFEYRKFLARWSKPVRDPDVVTREPATFTIAEVRRNSGDPDIVSLWNAPHIKRDATLYSFDRDRYMSKLARALCEEAGLDFTNDAGFGGGERQYLEFAKIEGEYAFDKSFAESKGPFIGTLADCASEKEKCRERVDAIVRVRAIRKAGKSIPNAGDVALALKDIARRLDSVQARRGEADLQAAKKRVRDLAAEVAKATGSAA